MKSEHLSCLDAPLILTRGDSLPEELQSGKALKMREEEKQDPAIYIHIILYNYIYPSNSEDHIALKVPMFVLLESFFRKPPRFVCH